MKSCDVLDDTINKFNILLLIELGESSDEDRDRPALISPQMQNPVLHKASLAKVVEQLFSSPGLGKDIYHRDIAQLTE